MINKDNIVPKFEDMIIESDGIWSIILAIKDGFSSGNGNFNLYMPAFEAVIKKSRQLTSDLADMAEEVESAIKSHRKPIQENNNEVINR